MTFLFVPTVFCANHYQRYQWMIVGVISPSLIIRIWHAKKFKKYWMTKNLRFQFLHKNIFQILGKKKCQPVHTHTLFKSTLCAIKQNMKLCRIQTFLNGAAIMKLSCICSLIETYSADSWGRELSPTWAWYGNPRMFSNPTAQFEELGPNICFLCWRNCCGKTHWCIVSRFFFFMSLCLFCFICE